MSAETRRRVLIVDDEERFAVTLAQALERRGWATVVAHTADAALAAAREWAPDAAVVDLRIGRDDGLTVVGALRGFDARMRILVLTGYASIATAVRAIKLGADDYLAKPVTGSVVADALRRGDRPAEQAAPATPMSPRRLEWEHIQRVLAEHGGNISATARTLNMHRRTLQRKLAKRPAQS
ncbi:MAG TPA: response regulator [Gammaproteobacteria bacterium]|jgi:two-component system response regulator RegA|nr:response regulator [Gammaproteobacteria bacterium]